MKTVVECRVGGWLSSWAGGRQLCQLESWWVPGFHPSLCTLQISYHVHVLPFNIPTSKKTLEKRALPPCIRPPPPKKTRPCPPPPRAPP